MFDAEIQITTTWKYQIPTKYHHCSNDILHTVLHRDVIRYIKVVAKDNSNLRVKPIEMFNNDLSCKAIYPSDDSAAFIEFEISIKLSVSGLVLNNDNDMEQVCKECENGLAVHASTWPNGTATPNTADIISANLKVINVCKTKII